MGMMGYYHLHSRLARLRFLRDSLQHSSVLCSDCLVGYPWAPQRRRERSQNETWNVDPADITQSRDNRLCTTCVTEVICGFTINGTQTTADTIHVSTIWLRELRSRIKLLPWPAARHPPSSRVRAYACACSFSVCALAASALLSRARMYIGVMCNL